MHTSAARITTGSPGPGCVCSGQVETEVTLCIIGHSDAAFNVTGQLLV